MAEQKDTEEKKEEPGGAEAEKVDKPVDDEKKKHQRETILQWIGEVEPAAKAVEHPEPAATKAVEPARPVAPFETQLVDVPTLRETQEVIEAPAVPSPVKVIEPTPEPVPAPEPIPEPTPEPEPQLVSRLELQSEPPPAEAPVPYLPPKKIKPVKVKKPWGLVFRPLFAKKQKPPKE